MPPTATPIAPASGGNLSPATPGGTAAASGGNLAPDGPFGMAAQGGGNIVVSGVTTAGVNGTLIPSGMLNGRMVWTSDGVWPRPAAGAATYTYVLFNGSFWHVGRRTEGASPTVYYLGISPFALTINSPVGLTYSVSTGTGAAAVAVPTLDATGSAAASGGNLAPTAPAALTAASGGNLAPAAPGAIA